AALLRFPSAIVTGSITKDGNVGAGGPSDQAEQELAAAGPTPTSFERPTATRVVGVVPSYAVAPRVSDLPSQTTPGSGEGNPLKTDLGASGAARVWPFATLLDGPLSSVLPELLLQER